MKFIGIIPARYASTRFPGKPLVEIQGKSMIQRVYEQALKCPHLHAVTVATDDMRIFDHVLQFGKVVLTSEKHLSGTDRCFEAAELLSDDFQINSQDVIINIQGDEPFIKPEQIEDLCKCFEDAQSQIATLVKKIDNSQMLFDPNVVKVVFDNSGKALYFSRSPIPYCRAAESTNWVNKLNYFRHLGMYGYRFNVLQLITKLGVSSLEKAESLEQLRWIQNGFSIQTRITHFDAMAIDTPADLEKIVSALNP